MEIDAVKLAEIVISSIPEQDPVQLPKQWPELFKSGREVSYPLYGHTV